MAGPLAGLKILDMSRILAGPWAGQLLADLGADVIKIERPKYGDDTRSWGPPYLKDRDGKDTEDAAYFFCANRGKKSVTVDITCLEGQEIIRQLARQSDVLIENYKVGGLANYGLDYHSLSKINPELIYCSITGFGQTGPYADLPGYDFLIQGMGGLMSVTGEPDDHEKGTGSPTKVGVAVTDLFTGLYASNAIQAALVERQTSGLGQYIDLALLDVQVATLANQASNYLVGGLVPNRLGNAHPNIVPYQAFSCSDGHIIIAVGNDQQFSRLCDVLEQATLASDRRYITNADRVNNRYSLCHLIQHHLNEYDCAHWLDKLKQHSVPCGPINTIEQVFGDPQVIARNMIISASEKRGGSIKMTGNPIKFSRSKMKTYTAPPQLGGSNEKVLQNFLKYSDSDIARLKAKSVID